MVDDDRRRPQRPGRRPPPGGAGRTQRRGRHEARAGRPSRDDGLVVLYGHHSVLEALKNPARRHHRLLCTENAAHRLASALEPLPIAPTIVQPEDIGRQLSPDAVHQGAMLLAEPLPTLDVEDLPPQGIVLVLDEVTDPHNVGAIMRTAAAFAVTALVTTYRHSPEMTGVLAKAASGALEHVPVVVARNLAKTLAALGDHGFRRVGLDSEAEAELAALAAPGPTALVLGAEGKGLRPSTRAACDAIARLDLPGAIASLNVSNAAAIALYALSTGRQR